MKLQTLVKKIKDEYKWWNDISQHGCGDVFYEDGVNMNLIRNHIIFLKNQIITQAKEEGGQIPQEVFWALPPEVPNTFMVKSGKHYKRCKNWSKEKVSKIVLKADTDMALF